jgi:hypothetical protein
LFIWSLPDWQAPFLAVFPPEGGKKGFQMQQPNLLPGGFSSPRRRTNLAPVFAAVFLLVFSGAGYVIWLRLADAHKVPPPDSPNEKIHTVSPSAADPLMEDLSIHFQNAIRGTVRSSELVKQSQTRIRAVLPAMDRNYLTLERARLEAADSLAEEAIREANRASEELEVARRLTQQKINKGEK